MEHTLALTLTVILALGVAAQWLAWRLHVPAIVLLMAAGLAAGPGLGWLDPSRDLGPLLPAIVKLAVAVILFEGGLNLRVHELRETARGVLHLIFVGALLNWLLGSAAGHYIGGLEWPVATIFGAIIVVTGPTVIMPLLRHAQLKRRPASYLKWEGIINDPIGAVLAVVLFQYVVAAEQTHSVPVIFLGVAWSLLAGAAVGVGAGYGLAAAFQRGYVPEFLKAPILLGSVLVVYMVANLAQDEAGLLATTVLGLTMSNLRLAGIDELRRFKEYITVLLVSVVFILLTAGLEPGTLEPLADWRSAALLAAAVFLVRPLAIGLATLRSEMSWRERLLVAWIGPRGIVAAAVAGVFGPLLVAHGYPDGRMLLPLVFALILLTVTLHGLSIGWLARRLDLAFAARNGLLMVGASPWTVGLAQALREHEVSVLMVDSSWSRLKEARLAGVPVLFGEILSEFAEEHFDLQDSGYLLAATYNDAYNALVCSRFAPELGRNRVLQLPLYGTEEGEPEALTHTLRGDIAFDTEARYDELLRRHYQGWTFQKTHLTEAYDDETFRRDAPRDTLPLLVVHEEGGLSFARPEQELRTRPGDVLVSYQPPEAAEREQRRQQAGHQAKERRRAERGGGDDVEDG